MKELKLKSSAFCDGGWIPDRFSGYGEDISPELFVEGLDRSAVSLIVTLDDMDHPIVPGYNHWVAWNLPPVCRIPEALPHGAVCQAPFHMEQGLAYGKHGYRGPKPPFNWLHRYRFTVFALDSLLELSPDADKKAVLAAAEGHILAAGCLYGKYQRRHKEKSNYRVLKLREHPELLTCAAGWFHDKWSVPLSAYLDSMKICLENKGAVPQWYAVTDGTRIIGGLGVIENDFHNRRDLSPNVCAVYVEQAYRCRGIAGRMLDFVCRDMRSFGISTLYLLTDHTSFYERYGWRFLCDALGDGENKPSRMYIHTQD